MKLLVTGATGLIGAELLRQCSEKNYTIHYLTTSPKKIKKTPQLSGFYWNPSKNEIDISCFEGVNAIVNLAGASIAKRWTPAYKTKIIQSRVQSLQLLQTSLSSLKNHDVKTIATASAIGIYPHSYTAFYKEDYSEAATSFLGNVVTEWEKAADTFQKNSLPVAKIRVGIVLARKNGALPPLVRAIRGYAGAPLCSGAQWQSWIHVADIARIFLYAVENQLIGVYNGVAPQPVTQKELTKKIASILKKPLLLPAIPQWLLKFFMGEVASIACSSQQVSCHKIVEQGFSYQFPTLQAALNDLL